MPPLSVLDDEDMNVFRLHIRPKGGLADHERSVDYCLRAGVLGAGWPIETPSESLVTWDLYERLATKEYGPKGLSSVKLLYERVRPGNLIWSRDTKGKYYLAQVTSPWEYLDTKEGRDADIVNVVHCRICPVLQVDDVPGKIVACFRPQKTFQPIKDPNAVFYSQVLWNQVAGSSDYAPSPNHRHNIFSYLDAETTEDVVFIYLQSQRWIVIPNSRKADTMAYEVILIHRDTSERAVAQVKTGNTHLSTAGWESFNERIFLFQANGLYTGTPSPNVTTLEPSTIEKFMCSHIKLMPNSAKRWLSYIDFCDDVD
jgi:hypothetical protein